MDKIAFVTVGWFWNPMNAWMFRNRLADEGIDAFLADEHVVSTYWLYANAIGGIKVQVPREQLLRSQEVLARDKSDILTLARRTPTDADQQVCQKCGSPELYRERFAVRFVFLSFLLLGLPLPIPSRALTCYDCGARYGAPISFKFQYNLSHLLFLMFIVAFVLGLMSLTGHGWFESASSPSETLW